MEESKWKLILNLYDGTMKKLNITPKFKKSKVEFKVEYYNKDDILVKASIIFKDVIAIDFQINYFDNYIGSELGGFYEILDKKAKITMVEKIFNNRLESYLYDGDYTYGPNEDGMIDYRANIDDILKEIDKYKLYQQQTQGGIFYILAMHHIICL